MELIKDALTEACVDTLAVLPFLFIIYFMLELLEHRFSHKTPNIKHYGPVIASAVGIFPQCGFSIAATTLFNKRVITVGTLLAVYLATSDEAIPILLAHPDQFTTVIKVIGVKFIIGLIAGTLIDAFIKSPPSDDCYCSDCHETPEHSHSGVLHHHQNAIVHILQHSIKKTLQIFLFLLISMFFINCIISMVGQEQLENFLSSGKILQPFICGLIGLIPTCVPSILITQLLLNGTLSFGSAIAGLCASSGMGIMILLKENGDPKRICTVIVLLYFISALSGTILNLFPI